MRKVVCLFVMMILMLSFVSCKDNNQSEKDINNETGSNNLENVSPMGTNLDYDYKNDYFEFGIKLDEQWKIYSDEKILSVNNFTEKPNDSDIDINIVITDMIAANETTNDKVSVSFTKYADDTHPTTSDYAQFILDEHIYRLELDGYTDVSAEVSTIDLLDSTYDCVYVNGSYNNENRRYLYIYLDYESYIVEMELISESEEGLEETISKIYKIN